MKKITSSDSLVTISHYKNILTTEGIPAFIKNEHLGGILGEMPFQEVWPQLWVENDLDYDRAKQLIDAQTILTKARARCGAANAVMKRTKASSVPAGPAGSRASSQGASSGVGAKA